MPKLPKYFIIGIIVFAFLIASISVVLLFQIKESITSNPPVASLPTPIPTIPQSIEEIIKSIGKFPSGEKVAQVGEETISGEDLNFLLTTFYTQDLASPGATLQTFKKKVLDHAIRDSVILQSWQKQNLVTLTADIFNNQGKDYHARQKQVRDMKEIFQKNQEKISGSSVSIWFKNQNLSSLPPSET